MFVCQQVLLLCEQSHWNRQLKSMQASFFPRGCVSKLPLTLIAVWSVILIIVYFFIVSRTSMPSSNESVRMPTHLLDAIVYVSMGKLSLDPIVDYSIASVRRLGKWHGKIYVITDSPACFADAEQKYQLQILTAPSVGSLIEIKAMKARLFDFIPHDNNAILYVDVDIVMRQSLDLFYKDLTEMMATRVSTTEANLSPIVHANETSFDFAAFPDAKGHYVGFCSGCEKWHTGVMYLRRNSGTQCMKKWGDIMLSGKYDTDQESLDETERQGHCRHAMTLPPRHLLFAKDYIAMMLSSGQTFIHFTSAVRLGSQDAFYRSLVIPNLRRSLDPPLSRAIIETPKKCLIHHSMPNITLPTS
jgi:hypothetical protein